MVDNGTIPSFCNENDEIIRNVSKLLNSNVNKPLLTKEEFKCLIQKLKEKYHSVFHFRFFDLPLPIQEHITSYCLHDTSEDVFTIPQISKAFRNIYNELLAKDFNINFKKFILFSKTTKGKWVITFLCLLKMCKDKIITSYDMILFHPKFREIHKYSNYLRVTFKTTGCLISSLYDYGMIFGNSENTFRKIFPEQNAIQISDRFKSLKDFSETVQDYLTLIHSDFEYFSIKMPEWSEQSLQSLHIPIIENDRNHLLRIMLFKGLLNNSSSNQIHFDCFEYCEKYCANKYSKNIYEKVYRYIYPLNDNECFW